MATEPSTSPSPSLWGGPHEEHDYGDKANLTGIKEGERVIGTVPHTANGTIFYTFDKGDLKGLKFGFSGYYTGKRNNQL